MENKKLSVLITSPSIDTTVNVGGISSLTRLLITKNNNVDYKHLVVGKSDTRKRNVKWFFLQISLIVSFIRIIRSNNIEIVHVNYPMSYLSIIVNCVLILISKLFRKKVIIHLRGGALSLNSNIYLFQKIIIKVSLVLSNMVLVLGEKEKEFISEFYNISSSKIKIFPNAVEIPTNVIPTNDSIEKISPLKILFLGRIDKDKGLSEILLAFESLNYLIDYHFYLAGTGPDEEKFIEECNDIIGQKFTYLGVLNRNEKIPVLRNVDIFILPSYFEGLPNALLESMAYGVVPIVTPVGSIPEVVENSKNGFIVPKNNCKSIVDIILMLSNDRQQLKQIGAEAYKTIVNFYSIDKYILRLNSLYEKL